jgi:hypothetical protein
MAKDPQESIMPYFDTTPRVLCRGSEIRYSVERLPKWYIR